jgi:hypothetical protein
VQIGILNIFFNFLLYSISNNNMFQMLHKLSKFFYLAYLCNIFLLEVGGNDHMMDPIYL